MTRRSEGVFRWAAPVFAHADRRWSADDAAAFAGHLRPYVPPHGRLLDLGGGTGGLAGLLARELSCTVTVVDRSPHMLRYAQGIPGVETAVGDAAALPCPDDRFDAALVSDAFHHFDAPEAALAEIARVVRPGGGVIVAELDPDRPSIRAIAVIERLLREPAGFVRPEEMERLQARAGVVGTARHQRGPSYLFIGEVTGEAGRSGVLLRDARPPDAEALTGLALRSKAHWGYSPEFMDSCREELAVHPDLLTAADSRYVVAELDDAPIGYYGVRRVAPTAFELEALFVEPAHIGTGVGRRLMGHALRHVAEQGGGELTIQGDPHAERFYEAAGGRRVGTRPSGSIRGRELPLFRIDVPSQSETCG